ncbi:MAG: sensor domain-containing protein [Mycobacteriaceae bacterium]|nr:sensor domain-containing protein [Mycobacteriaceae bacterium]
MTPQPPRHTRRRQALRALATLLAGCAAAAACTNPSSGPAKPSATPPPATAAPTTTASLVPASAITGKLLTRNELAEIIGDTELQEVTSYAKPDYVTEGVDPPECGQRVLVGDSFTYESDQRAAMDGNSNVGAAGKRAGQVVSIWATTKMAKESATMMADDWNSCKENQQFKITADNALAQWTAGPVTVTATRTTTTAQRQQPTPRTCTHITATELNVMVETVVCGTDQDTSGQANQIADRILAKFPH